MSPLQKLVVAVLPETWVQKIEGESRCWFALCPCGFERTYWDAGGIRWKGAGKEKVYLYCPNCHVSHFHTIYRKPFVKDREFVHKHVEK